MIGKKKKQEMEQENDDLLKKQDESSEGSQEVPEKPEDATENKQKASAHESHKKEAKSVDHAKQLEELNDKYLRLYAEFDNYRRRTLRERAELIQGASSDLIIALLPVMDDFDRAVKAFEQSKEVDALKDGIVLIQQKFKGILTQKGLEEMKSIGEHFNTDLHEAVANIPADKEDNKDKVMDEVEKGYLLNGKVIRFAKVVVAN